MKIETIADILSEIRDFCGEVLNGSRKIEPTYLMTGRETRDLESACERNDVWEVLRQLHTFRGTPNAGEVIARLETAIASDVLWQSLAVAAVNPSSNNPVNDLDLF